MEVYIGGATITSPVRELLVGLLFLPVESPMSLREGRIDIAPTIALYFQKTVTQGDKSVRQITEIIPWHQIRGIQFVYENLTNESWKGLPLQNNPPLHMDLTDFYPEPDNQIVDTIPPTKKPTVN